MPVETNFKIMESRLIIWTPVYPGFHYIYIGEILELILQKDVKLIVKALFVL